MISIIFGFANEEVQNVLRTHWKRKMMVRMVKREGRQRSKRKFGEWNKGLHMVNKTGFDILIIEINA